MASVNIRKKFCLSGECTMKMEKFSTQDELKAEPNRSDWSTPWIAERKRLHCNDEAKSVVYVSEVPGTSDITGSMED